MQVDATAFDELTLGGERDLKVELHSCRSILAPLFRDLERTARNCQSLGEFRRESDLLLHSGSKKMGAGPVGMAPNRVTDGFGPSWTTGICRAKVRALRQARVFCRCAKARVMLRV